MMQEFKDIPYRHRLAGKSHFKRVKDVLSRNEKIKYLSNANMGGEVVVAITNERIIMRPSYSMFKSSDERAVADLKYSSIDALRQTGVKGNKIEIETKRIKYDSIENLKGMAEYISEKAGMEKVIICPDCETANKFDSEKCRRCKRILAERGKKAKNAVKKGAGIAGAIGGGVAAAIGGFFGIVFILIGLLLTLTIIGALIGIPLIFVGAILLMGSGAFGLGGFAAGKAAGRVGQVEWRRSENQF